MSLYILDTDTFSLYQHTQPAVTANVARHLSDRLVVSVVSAGERGSRPRRLLW